MKILIPTCRPREDVQALVDDITTTSKGVSIYASCQDVSAAENRNWCLQHVAAGEVAIMLDDDITGFYCGWVDDLTVAMARPNVVMVSARLLRRDGRPSQTCSRCYDLTPSEIDIKPGRNCILPTAAIAFRHAGIMFDEQYRGSGYEDSDWCFQYLATVSDAVFVQSNRCRLIHLNEMKQQRENWQHNQAYFQNKWPSIPCKHT